SVEALESVTAAAFGQRRKMLRSSLKNIFQDTEETIEKIGIDASLRAEQLSVSEFCELAQLRHEQSGTKG
ncbi:MAG: hypothetical protein OEM91_16680, partial [Hyphomicrobiales bacterium]|nr:hypothetical protein [Hyphomicrobiales bacterium]